jgi:hypothetical protein
MKIETMMWLLPVVFMLHEFEEIIMIRPWLAKNAGDLQRRFPSLASQLLPHFQKLSTSALAFAVAEEFILLSVLTYLAVEFELYAAWAGLLIAFFSHLLIHIIQFALYRKYVPVIVTSLLCSPYCLFALDFLNSHTSIDWSDMTNWSLIAALGLGANLVFVHFLAARFEHWLNTNFAS